MTASRIAELGGDRTRRLTQEERLMVGCVVVALLACLAIGFVVFFGPALDAAKLAGM